MNFLEYELTADALVMGERPKAGTFLPCVQTIPYSQITGALRRHFSDKPELHAAGHLVEEDGRNVPDWLIYSPRDRGTQKSKVPLQVQFLRNVLARVYLPQNEASKGLPDAFDLAMGGFLSKGFGMCHLRRVGEVDGGNPTPGLLNTRIPIKRLPLFNVKDKGAPIYGYLFQPDRDNPLTGIYVLSLFESSVVVGPPFLLQPRR